jgi:hypothetical protein
LLQPVFLPDGSCNKIALATAQSWWNSQTKSSFVWEGDMKHFDRIGARTKIGAIVMAGALLTSVLASPAAAETVRWRTIIGIIQAGNLVGNIGGGGQPWSTLGGRAKADLAAGRVDFEVEGLVLAGGNTIGTPGAVNQVKGTLICDAGGANVTIDTVLVPLSPQGDAEFSGSVGPIPSTCTSSNVAFLVRIAAGRWIANGSVRSSTSGQ